MNFNDCEVVGRRGVAAMRPALEREYAGRSLVVEFDGFDGFATKGGDLVVAQRSGDVLRVECKTEQRYTGNLFIEEWSDYLKRPGWAATLSADVLAYYFEDTGNAYLIRWPAFHEWFYNSAGLWEKWPGLKVARAEQRNKTCGRAVPVSRVESNVGLVRWHLPDMTRTEVKAAPKRYAGGLFVGLER